MEAPWILAGTRPRGRGETAPPFWVFMCAVFVSPRRFHKMGGLRALGLLLGAHSWIHLAEAQGLIGLDLRPPGIRTFFGVHEHGPKNEIPGGVRKASSTTVVCVQRDARLDRHALGALSGEMAGSAGKGGSMAKSRNWNDLYKQLFQSLADDAATGRRMLVVLGSGCSASLGLPTMRLIFKWLHSQLIKMLEEPRYVDAKKARAIRALSEDLETMNNGGGSRAVAARALRLLQHAPLRSDLERFERKEKTPDTSATEVCRDLWRSFGVAFLNCEIREANAASNQTEPLPLKQPTHFHKFIADLVKLDRAIPLSLNFDGLTRKAINQALASEVKAPPCVILSSPETIRGFFCASPSGTSPTKFVVKVWGDVFHAVCQTPSCPQFGREVPLYDIGNTETGSIPRARPSSDIVENRAAQSPKGLFDERTPQVNVPSESSGQPLLTSAELLRCPDCHGDRQLQVFFAGYHEKERRTEELISALETFISPTIGSLLIAGFSGNWDSSLVEYLVALAREVDRRKGSTSKVFCIDQDETTHIRRLIKAENVVIIPETEMGCEEFADSADQYRR